MWLPSFAAQYGICTMSGVLPPPPLMGIGTHPSNKGNSN